MEIFYQIFDEDKPKVYYNCIDSKYNAKGILSITDTNQKNIINHNFDDNSFTLTKNHSLTYECHNYNIINEITNDINNLSVQNISKKLKNYEYMKNFVKTYAILNQNKNLTQLKLLKDI